MPGEPAAIVAKGADQAGHVFYERPDVVSRRRLFGLVVSAQVRRHDPKSRREDRDLMAPRVPELGKSMKQQQKWAVASLNVVKPDTVGAKEPVPPRSVIAWGHRKRLHARTLP